MNRLLILLLAVTSVLSAQQQTRFSATTGNVSLSAATAVTIQQLSSPTAIILIDQVVVYCSVACTVTQSANGTAATATAGTITPILPTPLSTVIAATFWTGSNVGAGTIQGGVTNIPAGGTVTLCLSPSCGNPMQVFLGTSGGTANNYSVSLASLVGTANITVYGRTQ